MDYITAVEAFKLKRYLTLSALPARVELTIRGITLEDGEGGEEAHV